MMMSWMSRLQKVVMTWAWMKTIATTLLAQMKVLYHHHIINNLFSTIKNKYTIFHLKLEDMDLDQPLSTRDLSS
ncbi:MAG: hypothetical protein MJE68_20485, partial [Proteobacteria bacterium]|nr:hypothetical protein [Pseudomonadota bacterium]